MFEIDVRRPRRGPGGAADRHRQARRVIDVTSRKIPTPRSCWSIRRSFTSKGKQNTDEGCLSIPEFREKVTRARRSPSARRTLKAKLFEIDRRRTAGARLSARNRSPQRQALHQPHQRAQARSDEAQDPQADESRRVVSRHDGPGFLRHAAFAVPTLERLFSAGFRDSGSWSPSRTAPGPRHGACRVSGEADGAALGLPVNQPEKIKNNEEFRAQLEASSRDAIIVVGYGRIIPQWMIDLPPLGNINLHASLLPKYRGAAPISGRSRTAKRVTGVTTMRIDAGLDTGDMLLQREMRSARTILL